MSLWSWARTSGHLYLPLKNILPMSEQRFLPFRYAPLYQYDKASRLNSHSMLAHSFSWSVIPRDANSNSASMPPEHHHRIVR